MNGHKFIIYSMSSYGDKGKVLAYFFLFVCLIFWMVIQKVFVIISQVELIFIAECKLKKLEIKVALHLYMYEKLT